MSHQLSTRVNNIKPSATLAIDSRAKKMQADGGDVINLGAGEPDFRTPEHIVDAAIKALHDGYTKYTAIAGIPELRKAICHKFERENNLNYTINEVIASNGAKQSIYNAIQVLINPGDEVIIPKPYWVSYPEIVTIADGRPVFIDTDSSKNFKITAADLEAAITAKTKLLILNSPSNPSGMAYNKEELALLAEVLLRHPQVYILSDDMYEHIMWTANFCNIVNVCPELKSRTIVVNGVSKAYSMTGWRIGYAAADKDIVDAMIKVQSQTTSNPNSIAQYASVAALNGDQQCVKDMVKQFKLRHDSIMTNLNKISGIHCQANHGTFYAFPDCQALINSSKQFTNDMELAEFLLTKAGVATVPGSAFGMPGCLRLSYALSIEVLEDALVRMRTVLS